MGDFQAIDVSKWQDPSKFDWDGLTEYSEQLRQTTGHPLILIARATYGANMRDERFAQYATISRSRKFIFGAYHFYRQTHSVEAQMAAWNQQMDAIEGLQSGDLFPVLDMEDNRTNGDGRVKKKLWNRACDEIGDALKEEYGGCILYYSSFFPDMLDAHKKDANWRWMQEEGYHHWLADYSRPDGQPRNPYTPTWALHQSKPSPMPFYNRGQSPIDKNFANPDFDLSKLQIGTVDEPTDDDDDAAPTPPFESESEILTGWSEIALGLRQASAGASKVFNNT